MDQMVQVQILSLHNYTNIYGTYITYILYTHTHTHTHTHISFKFPNWINHELKSRFPGEISTSSDRH